MFIGRAAERGKRWEQVEVAGWEREGKNWKETGRRSEKHRNRASPQAGEQPGQRRVSAPIKGAAGIGEGWDVVAGSGGWRGGSEKPPEHLFCSDSTPRALRLIKSQNH